MNRSALAVFILMAGLCSTSLHAQGLEVHFAAPFNFMIANKILPEGSYRAYARENKILIIQNINEPVGASTYIAFQDDLQPRTAAVQFNKYGDRFFLREIDAPEAGIYGELPVSKAEQQAKKHFPLQHVTIALNP